MHAALQIAATVLAEQVHGALEEEAEVLVGGGREGGKREREDCT